MGWLIASIFAFALGTWLLSEKSDWDLPSRDVITACGHLLVWCGGISSIVAGIALFLSYRAGGLP